MNIKKLLGFVAIIFVLFWVISAPGSASGSVNNVMSNLRGAGTSMTNFMGSVLGTGSTGSGRYENGRYDNGSGRYDNGNSRYDNGNGRGDRDHQHNRY